MLNDLSTGQIKKKEIFRNVNTNFTFYVNNIFIFEEKYKIISLM